MRILVTGACGFAGSTLARGLAEEGHDVVGLDNFIRPGSETSRAELKRRGVKLVYGDVRQPSDFEAVDGVDFVIDAAANPSVLAGVDGTSSSRQVVEHNLTGTLNLLEFCKQHRAGFILLSTSRVYSVPALASLPVASNDKRFSLVSGPGLPPHVSSLGIAEGFTTAAPVSLYGATKLASEHLALEYGAAFGFPVYINRCGVLAGAGQFGRPDQGIYAYWLNAHLRRRPLRYIGFGGQGFQVRDCLHPRDLLPLLEKQFHAVGAADRVIHCSGGLASARSLLELTSWCDDRWGRHAVAADLTPRTYDLPWVVLDASLAERVWGWKPLTTTEAILEEIAAHAEMHPNWLELSAPL